MTKLEGLLQKSAPPGLTLRELTELFHCTSAQAIAWVRRTGYRLENPRGQKGVIGCAWESLLLAKANRPMAEVAAQIGLSRERVRQLYEETGIPRMDCRKVGGGRPKLD